MKILVVESVGKNLKAAKSMLAGHELKFVKSFTEAMDVMLRHDHNAVARRLIESEAFQEDGGSVVLLEKDEPQTPIEFDVVLTDMMIPLERGDSILAPHGFVVALRAAQRGAKMIAMLADTCPRKDALSVSLAWLDYIDQGRERHEFGPNFSINGARAMFIHSPWVKNEHQEWVKDWGKVLAALTAEGPISR